MKNLSQMLKQAQEMQSKMAEMQTALGDLEVMGQSGGGFVTVTVNGKGDVKRAGRCKATSVLWPAVAHLVGEHLRLDAPGRDAAAVFARALDVQGHGPVLQSRDPARHRAPGRHRADRRSDA